MSRPTRRLILTLWAGLALAVLPAVVDPRLWIVWAGYLLLVIAAFVVDSLLAPRSDQLATDVGVPAMIHVGRPADLTVRIGAGSRRLRGTAVEARFDLHTDLVPPPDGRIDVPADGPGTTTLPLAARRRGRHAIHAVWLRWSGPLGLAQKRVRRALDASVAAVPDVHAVRLLALRMASNREFNQGLKVERHVGEGSEFDSLREYVPGLDSRAIDWKASARHTRLVCRDHRAERNHQVILAFDTGHLMSEPIGTVPKLDHAINAALLLAYVCLRTGDRVGLHAFDEAVRRRTAPRAGVQSLAALQAQTADLEYAAGETNFTVGLTDLLARLSRRSLIVLFTDFVDSITAELMLENVQHLLRRHVVILVALRDHTLDEAAGERPVTLRGLTRSVVAGDLLEEREAVLARLRRAGALCIDAPPARIGPHLINHYLDVKRRERI